MCDDLVGLTAEAAMGLSRWDEEQARRLTSALAPRISEAVAVFERSQSALVQKALAQAITPAWNQWLRGLRVAPPPLKLDYASLFPRVEAVRAPTAQQLWPALELIQRTQREQFADLFAMARRLIDAALPPNWPRGEWPAARDLEAMLLDEGLALAWVPPEPILVRVFDAESSAERRKIIGRSWEPIGRACLENLAEVTEPSLAENVEIATNAAEALLDGHHRASQALSAN